MQTLNVTTQYLLVIFVTNILTQWYLLLKTNFDSYDFYYSIVRVNLYDILKFKK